MEPCGHSAICRTCALQLLESSSALCPLCRKPFQRWRDGIFSGLQWLQCLFAWTLMLVGVEWCQIEAVIKALDVGSKLNLHSTGSTPQKEIGTLTKEVVATGLRASTGPGSTYVPTVRRHWCWYHEYSWNFMDRSKRGEQATEKLFSILNQNGVRNLPFEVGRIIMTPVAWILPNATPCRPWKLSKTEHGQPRFHGEESSFSHLLTIHLDSRFWFPVFHSPCTAFDEKMDPMIQCGTAKSCALGASFML